MKVFATTTAGQDHLDTRRKLLDIVLNRWLADCPVDIKSRSEERSLTVYVLTEEEVNKILASITRPEEVTYVERMICRPPRAMYKPRKAHKAEMANWTMSQLKDYLCQWDIPKQTVKMLFETQLEELCRMFHIRYSENVECRMDVINAAIQAHINSSKDDAPGNH